MNVRQTTVAIALAIICLLGLTMCVSCKQPAPAPQQQVLQQAPVAPQAQPMYQPAPPPVVIQQAPQSSGAGAAFMGSMAGSMVGNALSRPVAPAPVIHQTVNRTYITPSAQIRPVYRAPSPRFVRPAFRGRR